MKRKNFFILLELPFDPPTDDITQIKTAIHAKNSEWSRMYASPEQKSIALEYIQLIPEIEAVMLNDESRHKEAADARLVRGAMANSFEAELRILETKGYVTPREVKEMHEKYRPYGFDYALIKRLVRVPITDLPPKNASEEVFTAALDIKTAKLIENHLAIIGQRDLYSFLGRSKDDSAKDLYNVASALRNHLFQSTENSSDSNAKLMLCDLAILVFENEQTKASYDTYLKVNTFPELSELIQAEQDRVGFISTDVLMRLVNFGITTYGSDVLSLEEYIRNYCKAYNIDINIAAKLITCPVCHHTSPRGTAFCPECSSPLQGNCPKCNTFFTDGAKTCAACGFPVGEMGLAIPYIEKARLDLLDNNWVSATTNINNIEKYWPTNENLTTLKASLAAIKAKYEQLVGDIERDVHEHKFYHAQKLIDTAKKENFIVPAKLLDHVEKTLDKFEKQLLVYTSRSTVNYEELVALSDQVVDSLELNQQLASSPPEPPNRLNCRISTDGTYTELEWTKSESPGLVSYVVVRKQNSMPLTAFDGDIIYSGDNLACEDRSIAPLKNYFYSVFSKRANNYSTIGAVNVSPIMIIPKLEDFTVIPADGSAQINWVANPNVYQVKLWRKTGGKTPTNDDKGELLKNTRIDSYTDTDLKNDLLYWYYATAVYKTETGEVVESDGVVGEVTPHGVVIPIDQFFVLPTEEPNRYFVSWEGPSESDVVFFVSSSMPKHNFGQVVPMDTLMSSYDKLIIDSHLDNNGRFTLPFVGERFIFPVIVRGKLATVGRFERLVNVPEPQNLNYEIIGENLFIYLDWTEQPEISLTIAWREDIYPKDIDQKGNRIITVTKQEYDEFNAIKIPKISQTNYYFRVYNTFTPNDGKPIYSDGVNMQVVNTPAKEFFYNLDYKETVFSKLANIELGISSNYIFQLPKSVLVAKEGSIPLNRDDGVVLFEIDREQDVAGAISYKYKSEKLPKNLYVRMFFDNDKYYTELRPIPTNLVINLK